MMKLRAATKRALSMICDWAGLDRIGRILFLYSLSLFVPMPQIGVHCATQKIVDGSHFCAFTNA